MIGKQDKSKWWGDRKGAAKRAQTREGLFEKRWRKTPNEGRVREKRNGGERTAVEMATSDLTVRIKRGLVRDKERDYNQTEPVVQLLVRQHTKHVIN